LQHRRLAVAEMHSLESNLAAKLDLCGPLIRFYRLGRQQVVEREQRLVSHDDGWNYFDCLRPVLAEQAQGHEEGKQISDRHRPMGDATPPAIRTITLARIARLL
jgi:hypothetical protein